MYDYKLTFIGIIRKNKEDPLQFNRPSIRPEHISMFDYNRDFTLVSYIPDRKILLLSTLHRTDEIVGSTSDKHKPVIITEYNSTKRGLEVVDRLSSNYSYARNIKRWHVVIFYNMLNFAGINTQIIQQTIQTPTSLADNS